MARSHARRFKVGSKVAIAVIVFECLMLAAYSALTPIFVSPDKLPEILNLKQQNVVLLLLISSLVFAGYLTYLVITRIFQPFNEIARVTEEFIKGNLVPRLHIRTNDELEVLADRFNDMASALKQERDSLEMKVRDRTRQLEESQKKELEEQKDVVKLKDEFLFVAAHELRTPVTAIRWSLEGLDPQVLKDNTEREALQEAMLAARSLADLVNDLLNMARLDSKHIEFKKELVDMREVCKLVLKELEPIAKPRAMIMSLEAPEHKTIDALGDERRIREVLMNLAGNALKYNRNGGHVRLHIDASGGKVRLDVIDDGPGITPDEQEHVFQKFWRSKTHADVEGSGLGLFITKRLVEGMSGTITFSSSPGTGTTFTVMLPGSVAPVAA